MNIDKLKVMLELKAMQNFSSSSSQPSSMFQDIFNELLMESQTSMNSQPISTSTSALGMLDRLDKQSFTRLPQLSNTKLSGSFDDIIEKAAAQFNVPAKLIKSVVKQESNFNPTAMSHAGASGLMQLMPATARSLGVENVFDPEQNIMGGAKYLRNMLDKYDDNIELALAAYNAGPGNVDKFGGIPPFRETLNYVKKVTNHYYG